MLPDWPEVKSDIRKILNEFLRERVNHHLGIFRKAPRHRVFEGGKSYIQRASGRKDESEFKEMKVEIRYKTEELPNYTLDDILIQLDTAAQGLANQMASHTYETISEAVDQIGNVVSSKGEPFTIDTIFEALAKIDIEFDENGKPRMPQFHIHPDYYNTIKQAQEEYEKNSENKQRFKELFVSKKEEWRAREASRKLVG